MWAMIEEANNSEDALNKRFRYKEIESKYSYNKNSYTTEIIGNAQAIMFLCGRVAGAGEDYLSKIDTIEYNSQLNGRYIFDCADGKKGELCKIP
jgi:hypothetical protein